MEYTYSFGLIFTLEIILSHALRSSFCDQDIKCLTVFVKAGCSPVPEVLRSGAPGKGGPGRLEANEEVFSSISALSSC